MKKMDFWRFSIHCLLLTAILGSLLFLHSPTIMQAQDSDNPIITAYAATFDVTSNEAKRRLELQNEMSNLAIQVEMHEPTYAGSWIQHKPDFRLFISFTTPNGEEKIRKYLDGITWADLIGVSQSPFSIGELKKILKQIDRAAHETNIPYESGTNLQIGKVNLYTPKPEELRTQLESQAAIKQYIDDIEFIYQDTLSEGSALKYPYLPGGTPLSTCTAGFVVVRSDNNRRGISTAGHCDNSMTTVAGIYFGLTGNNNGWIENDPINDPPGNPFGNDMDFQVHDASVRSFDLTNVIYQNSTTTSHVVSSALKNSTQNEWVCKYGKSTGHTCGTVVDVNYSPSYAPGTGRYVKVENTSITGDIACAGDSGGPIFKFVTGGVSARGIQSGVATPTTCNGTHKYLIYTPVDEINRAGYSILTSHYQQRYYQNVFWTETSCTEYRTPFDNNGNPTTPQTNQSCSTSAPGNGTIQTYTGYVLGNYWREGMWRNDKGYTRKIPLNGNGTINWPSAESWVQCCSGTPPRSQDAFIVGNHYYQNVFWSETVCTEYKNPLDNYGNVVGPQTTQSCRTSAPGSGIIESYTAYVVGGRLREGMWRDGKGYTRDVPLPPAPRTDEATPTPVVSPQDYF